MSCANAAGFLAAVGSVAICQHQDLISFDEFGQWYNNCGGYIRAAWLELLDHTKWAADRLLKRGADDETASEDDGEDEQKGTCPASLCTLVLFWCFGCAQVARQVVTPGSLVHVACAAEEIVLQFLLTKNGRHKLQLTSVDCERLSRVVALTGLGMVDPERLHTLFNTQTVDGCLHKAGFDLCIRTLVPGNTLTYTDKQYVDHVSPITLSILYCSFIHSRRSWTCPAGS